MVAIEPAHAFFCFSFGFGSHGGSRSGPQTPPPRFAHPPPGPLTGYPPPVIQAPLNADAVMHQNAEPIRAGSAADARRRPATIHAPASPGIPATSAAFTIVRPAPASASSATSRTWPAATSSAVPALREPDNPHRAQTPRPGDTRLRETRSWKQSRRPAGVHAPVHAQDPFLPVEPAGTAAATPPHSYPLRPRRPANDGFLPAGSDPEFPRGAGD